MSQYQRAEDVALLISTRMAGIRKANGFETDIGRDVLRGARKVDDDWPPCSTVIEGMDDVEASPSKVTASAKIEQRYVLGGYAPCDPKHPNDTAHKIIRDIKRVIFADGATLGGKVTKVEYKGRDIGPRADGVGIVYAIVEIVVTYVENLAQP